MLFITFLNMQFKLLLIVLMIAVSAQTALSKLEKGSRKDSCNKQKLCKYGGKCDTKSGSCKCNFNCSPTFWSTTLYCGPIPKDGTTRKYFLNLCQLLASACEEQQDIPIVKYNIATQQCEDHVRPSSQLCTNPKDFMGPCGGTTSPYGSIEAGVCLRDTYNGDLRCECPSTLTGSDCHVRVLTQRSAPFPDFENKTEEGPMTKFSAQFAIFAVICFGIFIFLFFSQMKRKYFNKRKNKNYSCNATSNSFTEKASFVEINFDECSQSSSSSRKSLQNVLKPQLPMGSSRTESLNVQNAGTSQRRRLSGCSLVEVGRSTSETPIRDTVSSTTEYTRTDSKALPTLRPELNNNNNNNNNNHEEKD